MKKFIQYIILFFLTLLVGILGFFAFRASSSHLVFAFDYQDLQSSDRLLLMVDRPGTLSKIIPMGALLDHDAIKQSIIYNGEVLSGELLNNFAFEGGDDYIAIQPRSFDNGDILSISADLYNKNKKTSYSLGRDISVSLDQNFPKIVVNKNTIKDKKTIVNFDFDGYSSEQIDAFRWYVSYPDSANGCSEKNNILWNARRYREIENVQIAYNNNSATAELDIDSSKPFQCIIGGVGGDAFLFLERNLGDFTIMSHTGKILMQGENLMSEIRFDFSAPIFLESNMSSIEEGSRKKFLSNLLKKISISPAIDILEENIELSPQSLHIKGNFLENTKYTIHLSDVEDIYGRTSSSKIIFTPTADPFFALQFSQHIYSSPKDILAKLYVTKSHKKDLELRLCKLDVEGYTQLEAITQDKTKNHLGGVYNILYSRYSSNCQNKTIHLDGSSLYTSVGINDIFSDHPIKSGFYGLFLAHYEDANIFGNPLPAVFSVAQNDIFAHYSDKNHSSISVVDNKTKIPRQSYEIEIFPNNALEISTHDNLVANYSTGVILGKTNQDGNLYIANNEIFSRDGLIIARGEGNFGFLQLPKNTLQSNHGSVYMNNNTFTPDQKLQIFGHLALGQNPLQGELILSILDAKNIEIFTQKQQLTASGIFSFEKSLQDFPRGTYFIKVLHKNDQKTESILNSSFSVVLDNSKKSDFHVVFRGIDFDKNSPKHLRKVPLIEEGNKNYANKYISPIELELQVSGSLATGTKMKNMPFSYKVFSIAQGEKKKILEDNARIDSDGFGYVRIKTDFESVFDDVIYEVEVRGTDILTGREILKKEQLKVELPQEYKTFDEKLSVHAFAQNPVISSGEPLNVLVQIGQHGWKKDFAQKYQFEIIATSPESEKLYSSSIAESAFAISTQGYAPGKYTLRVRPNIADKIDFSENVISEVSFYVKEKNELPKDQVYVYAKPENDKISIEVLAPFTSGTTFLSISSHEKNEIKFLSIKNHSAKVSLKDFINEPEITIDAFLFDNEKKTFSHIKNIFIPKNKSKQDIFTNSHLNLSKKEFSTKDAISPQIELSSSGAFDANSKIDFVVQLSKDGRFANFSYFPNVSENSISIFPKDYTKDFIFEQKNHSSAGIIASSMPKIEWMNVFSNKISSKMGFDIPTPKDEGKYFLKIEAYKKGKKLHEWNDSFEVRDDYLLEVIIPKHVFAGDKIFIETIVHNRTPQIGLAEMSIRLDNNQQTTTLTGSSILNVGEPSRNQFEFTVPDNWIGETKYEILLQKGNQKIDSINGTMMIDSIPVTGLGRQQLGMTQKSQQINIISNDDLDNKKSQVEVTLGRNLSVIVPTLLEEIENTPTLTNIEKMRKWELQDEAHLLGIVKNELIAPQIQSWIQKQNIGDWSYEETLSAEQLQMLHLIVFAQKNGIIVEEKSFEKIKEFIVNREKYILDHSDKHYTDASKILLLGSGIGDNFLKGFDALFAHLQKSELSRSEMLDITEAFLLTKKPISPEWWRQLSEKFKEKDAHNLYDFWWYERARFLTLLFQNNEYDRATNAAIEMLGKYSGTSSVSQKYAIAKMAMMHTKKSPNTTINATISSLGVNGKVLINNEKPFHEMLFEREKMHGDITFSSERNIPLFYHVLEKNILNIPSLFPAKNSEHLQISTKIEYIDQKLGQKSSQEFVFQEAKDDTFLKKGHLYKMTIEVDVTNTDDKMWGELALKVPIPDWADVYLPNKSFLHNNWSYIQQDKNLLTLQALPSKGDKKLQFSYYFLPKKRGSYLLPANFVYFIEAREFSANNSHNYFHIQ